MTAEQMNYAEGFADGYSKGSRDGHEEAEEPSQFKGFIDGVMTFMTARFGPLPDSVVEAALTVPRDKVLVSALIRHFAAADTIDEVLDWRTQR